jgi:hypothetical protein
MIIVVMQNVIMLNVIMLRVIMLNVVRLSVIMLNVVMLSVIMLNVVMQNVTNAEPHMLRQHPCLKKQHRIIIWHFVNAKRWFFESIFT